MVERYSNRLNILGYDVKTLGWGSVEQQEYRFAQTISSEINFSGKSSDIYFMEIYYGTNIYREKVIYTQ